FAREARGPPWLASARHHSLLVVGTLLLAPLLAALSAAALPSHDVDVEVFSSLFLLCWGGLLLLLVLVDVAHGGRSVGLGQRRRGPWRTASRDAWCACVGLAMAAPVAAALPVDEGPLSLVVRTSFASAAVVALWLALVAFVTAGVAARVQTSVRRILAVTTVLGLLWFLS